MPKKILDPKFFGKVAVLMGGLSTEREISFMSGNNILASLCRQKINAYSIDVKEDVLFRLLQDKPERVFIALHGKGGEDGILQAVLEHLHIPYTGSGVAACALAMDKHRSKLIWQALQLPTPPFRIMHSLDQTEQITHDLGLPLFIKPIAEGSSLFASKVRTAAELNDAFTKITAHHAAALVEKYINGPEYTVSILRDTVLPSILIKTPHAFYDYQAKYFVDTTEYICPSDLTKSEEEHIAHLALSAYKALGCHGWGRVDFMRDKEGQFWILEINTAPGMTDHSLTPMAAKAVGISFDELVWQILEDSFSPHNEISI